MGLGCTPISSRQYSASGRCQRDANPGVVSLVLVLLASVGFCSARASSMSDDYADEIVARKYFGKLNRVPVVSNLTLEQFEKLALAGRPFVISDGGAGQALNGWTCERFGREFPKAVVKLEHGEHPPIVRSMSGSWQNEKHTLRRRDAESPELAPWYWGVKGADNPEEIPLIYSGGANPLPTVRLLMRSPTWMRSSPENQKEFFGSPEFWFSAPKAGARMHMDAHCESTYALQLSGTRRWRVGWVPPVRNGSLYRGGTYSDGNIYGKRYQPPLEVVVSEGQGFFMPSGFLHETINIGESCAASLTVQFCDPIPARYFRKMLRHLRRTEDFFECWGLLQEVAAFGVASGKRSRGGPPLIATFDKDGDGRISSSEAAGSRLTRAGHAFYDVNEDGFVDAEELDSGWTAWREADAEARKTKKITPTSFAHFAPASHSRQDL